MIFADEYPRSSLPLPAVTFLGTIAAAKSLSGLEAERLLLVLTALFVWHVKRGPCIMQAEFSLLS